MFLCGTAIHLLLFLWAVFGYDFGGLVGFGVLVVFGGFWGVGFGFPVLRSDLRG